MPLRSISEARRRALAGVEQCETHGPGCRKHRYPHPDIWGQRLSNGKWFITPDEALEIELNAVADQLEILRGMPRSEFLALPCKVVHIPAADYRKTVGTFTDVDPGLDERIREGRAQQALERHKQEVREGYGDAVPEFEED